MTQGETSTHASSKSPDPERRKLPDGWEMGKGHSRTLSKRFGFGSYAVTRQFLDGLAEIAEARARHPNISFGTTYANVTLECVSAESSDNAVAEGSHPGDDVNRADHEYVEDIEALAGRLQPVSEGAGA
ncbi:MAG: 4a-hydroxytetrahydrobiopterin dehydratase [Thioalkalivibrionaceae bacterium]